MKNVFSTQKSITWIVSIILLSAVAACKQADPEPPLADQIMGSYTATSYKVGTTTINLPATNTSGVTATAKITSMKVSEEVATFTFIFTQTKSGIQTSSNSKLENLTLKKANSGEIEGYKGASRAVVFKNSELTLTFTEPDPAKVIIVYAKKDM